MLTLLAQNASAWTGATGNNTYLFTGSHPALVDAGVGHAAHVESIERALNGPALESVLITHAHPDHLAGVPTLRERWPEVRVGKMPPDLTSDTVPLADGDRVEAGDVLLTVVATPGHSPDHCCFFDEANGDLYCGDLVREGGTIVVAASRGGDLAEYLESLQRARALRPKRLLPGHGPVIQDPERIIAEYLRHRADREAQVVEGLRRGAASPEQLVAAIYPDLQTALVPAAVEMMRAHLAKLSREGRAAEESGRWALTAR